MNEQSKVPGPFGGRMGGGCVGLLLASMIFIVSSVSAQDAEGPASIAVLRMKQINVSPGNSEKLLHFKDGLNKGLSRTGAFTTPDEELLLGTLDDEGVDDGDLIDLDDYMDVAEALDLDYMIIGSISQQMLTFHTDARLYSLPDGKFMGNVSAELGIDPITPLEDYVAARIIDFVKKPQEISSGYGSFEWSQELTVLLSTNRMDLDPPAVLFVNDNPPFEISYTVDMDRGRGGWVITNIPFYVDDESIGNVDVQLVPPIELRERDVEIDGHEFCFQLDVKEVRGRLGSTITGVKLVIKGRYCGD